VAVTQKKITDFIKGKALISSDPVWREYVECKASAIKTYMSEELAIKTCCEKILMKHGRIPKILEFCRKYIGGQHEREKRA